MRMLLPVLTIEIDNGDMFRLSIQTVDVDIDTIRIRARCIKRFDTARSAKRMLCNPGIERLGCDIVLS